jgi:hypothetical protein
LFVNSFYFFKNSFPAYEAAGEFVQKIESLQTSDPEFVTPLEVAAAVLDLKFLLYCCSDFIESSTNKKLVEFIRNSLVKPYVDNVEELTFTEEFYEEKIQSSIEKSVALTDAISVLKKK